MDHDRCRIAFGVEVPDSFKEAVTAEYQAGMFSQKDQEFKLSVSQADFPAFYVYAMLVDVDFEIAAAEDFPAAAFRTGLSGRPFIALDVSFYASDEFRRTKGFDDIIVGTEAETSYLVHVLPLGGHHENGDFLGFADAAADVEAVRTGEHDIQEDEVEIVG